MPRRLQASQKQLVVKIQLVDDDIVIHRRLAGYREVPGHVGAVVPDGRAGRVKQVEVVGPRVGSVQAASGAAEDGS